MYNLLSELNKHNIKADLKETEQENVDWMCSTRERFGDRVLHTITRFLDFIVLSSSNNTMLLQWICWEPQGKGWRLGDSWFRENTQRFEVAPCVIPSTVDGVFVTVPHDINPLTPNDPYRGRTAPLTFKVAFYIFIQQISVLNILNTVCTLRFFSLQNAVCLIILTYLVLVLFTFYIQGMLKLKK